MARLTGAKKAINAYEIRMELKAKAAASVRANNAASPLHKWRSSPSARLPFMPRP